MVIIIDQYHRNTLIKLIISEEETDSIKLLNKIIAINFQFYDVAFLSLRIFSKIKTELDPLQLSVFMNRKLITKQLLQHPFLNITRVDSFDNTILHQAIINMNHNAVNRLNMIQILLTSHSTKKDVMIKMILNSENKNGFTPIRLAMLPTYYDENIVSLLRNMVCNINVTLSSE